MMRTMLFALATVVFVGGCATPTPREAPEAAVGGATPPQLWSDHKRLQMPVDVCAERASNVLKALGYSNVARNGAFSYGNLDGNRAAVKCVETTPQESFVYFAVAGPKKETVEQLRNQIAWKL